MAIEFYYSEQSPPSRIVWMIFKELGIDYEETVIDFFTDDDRKSKSLAEINPQKQVPAIKDGEVTIAESRSIAIYICSKFESTDKKDKLYPKDLVEQARFHELMMRDADNYHMMKRYLNIEAMSEDRARGPDDALLSKCEKILKEYDEILAKNEYIFGSHLTFLDFTYTQTVSVMAISGYNDWGNYPNLKRWKGTMSELPYFEECIKIPDKISRRMYKMLLVHGPGNILASMTELQNKIYSQF